MTFKGSAERWRTIDGRRFVNWLIAPTEAQIEACRVTGIHYRRLDGDLFIPEAEIERARSVPALRQP